MYLQIYLKRKPSERDHLPHCIYIVPWIDRTGRSQSILAACDCSATPAWHSWHYCSGRCFQWLDREGYRSKITWYYIDSVTSLTVWLIIKIRLAVSNEPSFWRAVGVEVVNGSELQVVNRSIAVKAIALTPTVITNAVLITFIECITPWPDRVGLNIIQD